MDPLNISIFQFTASSGTPASRLSWLDMAAERAADKSSKLLICPELFMSGYNSGDKIREFAEPIDGEYAERVSEIATLHDIALIYGYPERNGGVIYNSAACIAPDGRMLANHRKIYLPNDYEKEYFTSGSEITVFEYAGWKIGLLICYDIEFPEAARQACLAGASLLVVPTALGSQWPFVAERVIPTRAFENGVYLAYANFSGQEGDLDYFGGSRIIGPDGSIEAVSEQGQEIISADLYSYKIENARERLPYLQDVQNNQIRG